MISLLIVDDEKHYTDSLTETLPWHELGIGQVYKAYNGNQALELLDSVPVDILMTDIQMPKMNGIKLIEEAMKVNPKIKCLLLTGYADFQYAKKAIELKAMDYVLKPADDEELLNSVHNIIQKIENERMFDTSMSVYKDQIRSLRSELLLKILRGTLQSSSLAEKLKRYDVQTLIGGYVHVSLIQWDELFNQYDAYSQSLFRFAITNIMEEIFKERYDIWAASDEDGTITALVYDHSGAPLDLTWVDQQIDRLKAEVKSLLKGGITVITPGECLFPNDLQSCYLKGKSQLSSRKNGESSYERTEEESALFNMLYAPPLLTHLLESEQWEEAEKKIGRILNVLYITNSPEHLRDVYFFLSNAFLYITKKHGKALSEMIKPELAQYFLGKPFFHVGQLEQWAIEILQQFKRGMVYAPANRHEVIVKRMQEYIRANLDKDISLTMLADNIYLHPNYLSKVFKQQMDLTVSQYIYYQRMDKASQLLKQTDDKIYNIGSQVGYPNTNWFIKKFKEYSQLTPQEYRDRHRLT